MDEEDLKKLFGQFDEEQIALDMVAQTLTNFYKAFRRQKLGIVEASIMTAAVVSVSGLINNHQPEGDSPDGKDLS